MSGRRILKLALNVEIFIYFFVFCWIAKKGEILCNEITQLFQNLEGAPNILFYNSNSNFIFRILNIIYFLSEIRHYYSFPVVTPSSDILN